MIFFCETRDFEIALEFED